MKMGQGGGTALGTIGRLVRGLAVAALMLLAALPAWGGVNQWTSNGPYGGEIRALAIDPVTPTTLYAGSDGGGVFKSTDGGDTWRRMNTGPPNQSINAIAINPTTPTKLFAGLYGGGVYKSTDGGNTWNQTNTGLTDITVHALAIDPISTTTLYAGTGSGGVFKSTDDGATWNRINSGLTNTTIISIAIDPKTTSTLYVGTSAGIFKSTNGGGSWNEATSGPASTYISAIAINPTTTSTLYAGTGSSGVIKSTDSGASWVQINAGLPTSRIQTLAIDSTNPDTLLAGYFTGLAKSTDGGNSWSEVTSYQPSVAYFTIAFDPATPSIAYAGTLGWGVFKSSDGGETWRDDNPGLSGTIINAVAIDPVTPQNIYAAQANSGIFFRSRDGGESWSTVNTTHNILKLAVDNASPASIYATTSDGMFKSTNGGDSWIPINNGIDRSTPELFTAIAVDPLAPSTIYIGTEQSGAVYKTTNGGDSWSRIGAGLPAAEILALAIAPTTPATLYAGIRNNGIYKSTDGGANWYQANTGLTGLNVTAVTVVPTSPSTLYAGTEFTGIFKSTNGGGSWNQVNSGIIGGTIVWAIAVAPTNSDTLYAGTNIYKVFRTTNGGGDWTQISSELSGISLLSLAVTPTAPTIVYAGTYGGGVNAMRVDLPPVTTAAPPAGVYPSAQTVTLSASMPASIYYTTNGSDPVTSSTRQVYTAPIAISTTTTIKFYAVDPYGVAEKPQTATYTISDPTKLDFTFGGNAPWFRQSAVSHDGVDAYQSGAISNSQSSWMETTVTGPGAVRFWWKVSSEACCDPLAFAIDGVSQANIRGEIDWQSKTLAVPAGSHTLRWTYSTDSSALTGSNTGWVDQITFEQGSNIDVTPPVTTASPAGGTVATPQTVTLSANEPATVYYTTNGSDPTNASQQYTAPLTIGSTTTLKFFALDTAGNYELTKSATYTFDTTPPNTSAYPAGGTYTGARDVSLSCYDAGSFCGTTYYCLGSGCTPSTPYTAPVTISASSDLRFYSTDRFGNSEAVKTIAYTITPDTTPPVTTPSTPSGTYGPLYAYLYCSDVNGSGCATTYYCLGAGCTPTTAYSSLVYITASTDFRFYSQDRSGNNEAVQTVSYVIDKTPPTTTATPPAGSYETAPLVTLSCSDENGTGCSTTYYCTGENCTPSTPYSSPVPIRDSTVLRFYSTDRAYNNETIVTQAYTNPSQPRTITVPGMRPSIQAAIDAAYNGDTILVAPGTYPENINFKGKGITVTSSDGADVTIIDGNKTGTVAIFSNGEGRTTVLNGFTLRNGKVGSGSTSNWDGGGIYIAHASPTILDNKITANSANWGGGIYTSFGSPLIRNNIITKNLASIYGGGISIGGSASAEVIDNIIEENGSSDGGGGISMWAAGTPTIRGNTLRHNTSGREGGGIWMVNGSSPAIVQNIIAENRGSAGGGIYWSVPYSDVGITLVNNTIVANDSTQGSGIYAGGYDANALLVNNLVTANAGQAAIHCEGNYDSLPPQMKNNLVFSPGGSPYSGICTDQNGVNGNITAPPLLSNPALGYYGPLPGSPAIDAGDGTAPSLPATDFGLMSRVVDGNSDGTATVDIGAYEFDPTRPVATLQGIPTDYLASNSLTINVRGTDVVSYRYALDGGTFTSTDIAVATPITLAALANGQHSIVVLGKNTLGLEQALSSATAATWVVNTETTNLTFTFGGTTPWFIQPLVSRDGIAYQSGVISNNQSSWMETTVTGPGAIRFWWKVSSDYSDQLVLTIDNSQQASISGEVDWQSKAFAIPAGNHTLRWKYSTNDYWLSGANAGWVDQITFEQGSNIDVTAPTTTATPSAGMYGSSQFVTLSCNDGTGSGCAGTLYCLGSGCNPSTPYTGTITISSATDLRFYSSDAAGNSESVRTATYTFDTTPPNTYANLNAGTYSGARDVSLYCSDGGLGCAATYYCLGSGCTPATPYVSAIAIAASTDLRFFSVDRGGNSETVRTVTFTITPDITAPTTSPSSASGTYRPLSVYLSCYDGAGSGCTATYYCLGAGCTPTTPVAGYILISSSTDLRFYSVDRSGNGEAISTVSYTIDPDPPRTTPNINSGIFTTPQLVALTCDDGAGAGCSATYYCLGKGCSPNTPYTESFVISSSTYLSYYSWDAVSNSETVKTERYTILTTTAATINVPGNSTTIQGAIDTANDGDTILVAPGTYQENINFKGKAITVTSSGGPGVTIIDGLQTGPVVRFTSGEWLTSVLEGFTFRNGKSASATPGYGGGGVLIQNSSPLVRSNRIIDNFGYTGAGVSVTNGSPLLQGNLIAHNQAGSSPWDGGGGVFLGDAQGTQLLDNTIIDNTAPNGNGGGILLSSSGKTLIRGNLIRNNTASGYGGGINMIDGNAPELIQNVIAGNRAGSGGGIYWSAPDPSGFTLANNTIADNDAAQGSGIYAGGYKGNGLFINNIIAAKAGQAAMHCEDYYYDSHLPQLRNNVVFSQGGSAYSGICADQNGINGNITADPQLGSPAFGYYGLLPGSPAIDAGDNSAPSLPATDLNGSPRLIAGTPNGQVRVDIGAYEFDPDEPRAVLTGAPASATRETSASITVSGPEIVSYRYALDGGPFSSSDTPVSTPIDLAGLAGGTHAVAVIGKTSSREQLASSATVAAWTIDTIPPVTRATPGSGTYTESQTVTLTCDDNSGSGCTETFYCLGGGCTPTTPYTGPIAVTSSAGLRFYSRDAFGYQEAIKTASYNFVGTLSGKITDSQTGSGIQNVSIAVYNAATGLWVSSGTTDSSGTYTVPGLAGGNYKLRFSGQNYIEQWYNGASNQSAAAAVAVSAPNTTTGINVIMVRGGSITGTVTAKDTGAGIQGVYVLAYTAATGTWVGSSNTDNSGAYTISGLAAGDYKIQLNATSTSGYLSQWFGNKSDLSSATAVTVTPANTTSGIDVALPKGGSITGTVTDSVSGAAIPGVYVNAVDAATGSWINSGSTDSSGVYTIAGLAGSYKLRFSGNNYVSQWYNGTADQAAATVVVVTAPNSTTGINMALTKGGSITGIVTDSATGAGIQNAYVSAYNAARGSFDGYTLTDSSGAYSLPWLATGSYKLLFSATGYVDQWSGGKADQATADAVAVTAPNSTAGINMALIRGGSITGVVTDSMTGAGIPGVNVSAYNVAMGTWTYGYTDAAGSYRVSGLPSGAYKLRFSAYGYVQKWSGDKADQATATAVAVTAPNSTAGMNMALEKGGSITGRVTDGITGAGIRDVSVSALNVVTGTWTFGYTDAAGSYSVSVLPSGTYKLRFFSSGYLERWYDGQSGQDNATVVTVTAPNSTAGINMALVKGGSITGMVTDSITGVGIARARAIVYDADSGAWIGSSDTDATGIYTVTGLATGRYRLDFQGHYLGYFEQWYDAKSDPGCANIVEVNSPATTTGINSTLTMGGSITGRVRDAATGAGVAGVRVSLGHGAIPGGATSVATDPGVRPASFGVPITAPFIGTDGAITDADGSYTISGIRSGSYTLSFSADGFISRWYNDGRTDPSTQTMVTVTAPNTTTGIDAALVRGGSISGRVTDTPTGAGIEGVWVYIFDSVTGSWLDGTSTGIDGTYTLTGLRSGSYKVHFEGRNAGYLGGWYGNSPDASAATPVVVSAPSTTSGIDATLVLGGSIAGRVTDSATGAAIPNIRVAVYDSASLTFVADTFTTPADTFMAPAGTFTIRGLPGGSYKVLFGGTEYSGGGYLSRWYANATDAAGAAVVSVPASGTVNGIDGALVKGGSISGNLVVSTCPSPGTIRVTAYDTATGSPAGSDWISPTYSTHFTIAGLPTGSYKLKFEGGGIVTQWFDGKADMGGADPVAVTAPGDTGGITVSLARIPVNPVLTVILQGSGSINSLIQPPVFTCASPSTSCGAAFAAGTPFTLQATPAAHHDFAGWTGQVCSGNDVCSFTLDSATTVTATFAPQPLVRIVGSGTPYNSFGAAWGDVATGTALRARNLVFDEDLYLALPGALFLTGGYTDREFTERSGLTTIHGVLTVGTGSLTVDGVAVQ